jgi:hypothetical protein
LQELSDRVDGFTRLRIAEAFVSNKPGRTPHHRDAEIIRSEFWSCEPVTLFENVHPLSPLVDGIPSVRVFAFPGGA